MQEKESLKDNRRFIPAIVGALVLLAMMLFILLTQEANARSTTVIPESNPERGKRLLVDYGCTGCHMVPGVRGADGLVGPPLHYWASRQYIAGRIQNTPENTISWIMAPQAMVPGSAMPDTGVTWGDARDIAAYLYTLRYQR